MELPNLKTKFLGKSIIYFPEIDSTQLEVWRRINQKTIQDGTMVIADIQTKGKRNTWKYMVYR